MTEIFCDESNSVLQDMRQCMIAARKQKTYDEDFVQRLFRGVHTLKADSTMMLYDQMAELSRTLEGLLYCFKGKSGIVVDVKRFTGIVNRYLDYFEEQTDSVAEGLLPVPYQAELLEQIKDYTEELKSGMNDTDKELYEKGVKKKRRQIFYIPGAAGEPDAAESSDAQEDDEKPADGEDKIKKSQNKFVKKYMIAEIDRERIFKSVRTLQRVLNQIEYTQGDDGVGIVEPEQLKKLKELQTELTEVKRQLKKTDFVPVAKKLELVVDEMAEKLHKNVKLTVKGEETPVDYEIREKLSAALTHVIRNAVDHGIEDMDGRELAGKSPMGLISLRFQTSDGHLEISVEDDGRGMDQKAILEKAKKEGLLYKEEEEYTKSEIFELVLKSGLTTKEVPGEYSGRGVGMDVIAKNVEELGGALEIDSEEGMGTKIVIIL